MRRPVFVLVAVLILAVVARADLLAAAVVAVGVLALWFVIRHRGLRGSRVAIAGLLAGITAVGALAALAVPTFKASLDPILVPSDQSAGSHLAKRGTFELNGYVVSDNTNAANAVDVQSPNLSTVSATGGLVNTDGTFQYVPAQNALVHAHFGGARAQLVVQNFDAAGGDFSTSLAHAALADAASRQAFVTGLAAVVAADHWDGVVIDFEQVDRVDQPGLVDLLTRLRAALPVGSRLMAAVPVAQADNPTSQGYDLAAIAKTVDVIQLMTYDQNDPTSSPGPLGSLSWMDAAVVSALRSVPASQLQIGAASYGYAWGKSSVTAGESYSPAEARAFAKSRHLTPVWSTPANGWTVKLLDGTVLWWSDTRSVDAVVALATLHHLEGVAVWEISTADSLASIAAKVPLDRYTVNAEVARGVRKVSARGLVALTFDDGPDPTWTPQILAILAQQGVPGTFFDVGMAAQAHPDLVRQEIAQGNLIANHTYSHLDLTTIPLWRAKLEIASDSWVLQGITGRTPNLFRSPYGASELTDAQSAAHQDLASSLGMQPVGWNVDPLEWMRPGVSKIVAAATASTATDQIILLHDGGGDRSQTVAALTQIIATMHARGYLFVTPDQLDASMAAPYAAPPNTLLGQVGKLLMIASFGLWASAHTVTLWALGIIGALSLFRVLVSFPLAVANRRRSRRFHAALDGTPSKLTVTVMIPAHNESATIAKSMAAVSTVRGPLVQVIVAENGSTDALNAAMPDIVGDVVVLLDADTVLDAGFLEEILPHFIASDVGAVAGNVKVGNRHMLLGRLQALEYITSLAVDRRAQAQLGIVSVVPGAAGAFRRDALLRVGGWPARTLTEDADLTVELLAAGWKIPYEPEAISWTEAPATVAEVLHQRRRWSYGTTQVTEIHRQRVMAPSSGRLGMIGLPWLTLSQVLLPAAGPLVDFFLLWLVLNGDWAIAAGMLGLALAMETVVAMWALRSDRESWKFLLLLPAARFLWRPLLLAAVAGSLRAWLLGRAVGWAQAKRHNTVMVKVPA